LSHFDQKTPGENVGSPAEERTRRRIHIIRCPKMPCSWLGEKKRICPKALPGWNICRRRPIGIIHGDEILRYSFFPNHLKKQ